MRISLSIFSFLLGMKTLLACDFRPEVKGVISFSGPTTVMLKELGLLRHTKLKGISLFNPIGEKEFSGPVYPGGIFLSQSTLKSLENNVVFYDEGRELHRIFSSHPKIISREIKTRNLTPNEAIKVTLNILNDYVLGCEKKIVEIDDKVKKLEEKLLSKIPDNFPVVFYLGEFRNGRPPEMVIVQDGIVKWLIEKKKITSYPSKLAYVNWSTKTMRELPSKTLHVGIKDSAREMKKDITKVASRMTLIYPGSLVPGLTQLEAFVYWAEFL